MQGKVPLLGPYQFLTSLRLPASRISNLEGPHSETFSYTLNGLLCFSPCRLPARQKKKLSKRNCHDEVPRDVADLHHSSLP
jgi:hypothetical protein